ncbi:hypothetical protein MMC07_004482 [Pseudocyphellaria aurata]|nr:hypothetical protein [Pseudocyphellaria aurata]
MSLSTFKFVSLLVLISSAVLCTPQVPNQASDDTSNDGGSSTGVQDSYPNPPSDMTYLPINFQNTPNLVALYGNGLETTHATDSAVLDAGSDGAGSSTLNNQFGQTNLDGTDDFVDTTLFTPNTPLLAQVQTSPTNPGQISGERATGSEKPKDGSDEPIEDTPGETARKRGRQGKRPGFNEGARERDGYTDDKCPEGSRWACCLVKRAAKYGGWFCRWLTDNAVCDRKACCFPSAASPGVPDEYCPDFPPVRKKFNIFDELGDAWDNWGGPIIGPSSGGAAGAAGAAAAAGAGG